MKDKNRNNNLSGLLSAGATGLAGIGIGVLAAKKLKSPKGIGTQSIVKPENKLLTNLSKTGRDAAIKSKEMVVTSGLRIGRELNRGGRALTSTISSIGERTPSTIESLKKAITSQRSKNIATGSLVTGGTVGGLGLLGYGAKKLIEHRKSVIKAAKEAQYRTPREIPITDVVKPREINITEGEKLTLDQINLISQKGENLKSISQGTNLGTIKHKRTRKTVNQKVQARYRK